MSRSSPARSKSGEPPVPPVVWRWDASASGKAGAMQPFDEPTRALLEAAYQAGTESQVPIPGTVRAVDLSASVQLNTTTKFARGITRDGAPLTWPPTTASVPVSAARTVASENMASELPDNLQQCAQILQQMVDDPDASPFCSPVDWKAWRLFDYPDVIKHPMDLGTVNTKLKAGKYEDALQFAHDVRLVWSNCKTYNQDGSDYFKLAQKFSKNFEQQYKKIDLTADMGEIKEPTKDDKKKFGQNIYLIDSEVLGNVVTMLDERCEKCIDKTDPDEIEINIDKIDPLTFQAVDEFVKEHLSKQSSAGAKKKKRKRAS